jgi:hypothetical protein
MNNKLSTVVDY